MRQGAGVLRVLVLPLDMPRVCAMQASIQHSRRVKLEGELARLKEQTGQHLAAFAGIHGHWEGRWAAMLHDNVSPNCVVRWSRRADLKEALVKDLQNRCEKVCTAHTCRSVCMRERPCRWLIWRLSLIRHAISFCLFVRRRPRRCGGIHPSPVPFDVDAVYGWICRR